MARSSTKQPSVEELVAAAVAAALQGQTKGKGKATTKGKAADKQARTIKDPTARATVKQVYRIAALLWEQHYETAMPNPLTMGDVQQVIDDLA